MPTSQPNLDHLSLRFPPQVILQLTIKAITILASRETGHKFKWLPDPSSKQTEEEGQFGRSNEHLFLPTLWAGGDNIVIFQIFITMHFIVF